MLHQPETRERTGSPGWLWHLQHRHTFNFSSSGDRLSKQALVGRGLEMANHPLLSPQSLSPPTPSWSVEGAESPDHLGVLQTLVSPAFSGSCLWLMQFELSLALRQDGQLVLRKQSAGNSHLGSGIAHSPASLLPQLQSEMQSNVVGKELGQKRLKAWLVPVASPGRERGRSPRSHFLCHC